MKKFIAATSLVALAHFCDQAQTGQPVSFNSPYGYLDNVYDARGGHYSLDSVAVDTNMMYSGAAQLSYVQAGYFNIFYEAGSGMEDLSSVAEQRRSVLSQVLTDLSAMVVPASNAVRVNLWVRDFSKLPVAAQAGQVISYGSAFYSVPTSTLHAGLATNMIWTTINGGHDAYTNINSPFNQKQRGTDPSLGRYMHGVLAVDFSSPALSWNLNLSEAPQSNEYDLYTIFLKEVTHALGFQSLVGYDGNSTLGVPFYSRFDTHLRTRNGDRLLVQADPACPFSALSFNPLINAVQTLSPHSGQCGALPSMLNTDTTFCDSAVYYSGSVNQALYTPGCYEAGLSLSNFEDACQVPTAATPGNDHYFTMTNRTLPGIALRHLRQQEYAVLCDLGYRLSTSYGNQFVYGTLASYDGCNNTNVAAINDGFNANGELVYTGLAGAPITINITGDNGILNNDNATGFTCLQDLYKNGELSATSGSSGSFTYQSSTPGITLLRYYPTKGKAQSADPAYIWVNVVQSVCSPNNCSLTTEGDFEAALHCGNSIGLTAGTILNCWQDFTNSPDLLSRNCTNTCIKVAYNTYNQQNCAFTSSASDSYSGPGTGNDKFIGLYAGKFTSGFKMLEAIESGLSNPIVPGQQYIVSFWGKVNTDYAGLPATNIPGHVVFDALPNITSYISNYNSPLTSVIPTAKQLGSSITIPNDNQWHYYQIPFSITGGTNYNALIVSNDLFAGTLPAFESYVYLDDIGVVQAANMPLITPPPPVCTGQTIILDNYVSLTGGTFHGPGVSYNGTNYVFNSIGLSVGNHLVFYDYVAGSGCTYHMGITLNVVNGNLTVSLPASQSICGSGANNCVVLTANVTGSNSPFTYSWNNGTTTSNISACPTSSTTYVVSVTNGLGCVASASSVVNVMSNPVVTITSPVDNTCNTVNAVYTANITGSYTSINWSISPTPGSPNNIVVTGGYNSPTLTVNWNNLAAQATITCVVNNGPCSVTQTITVYRCCDISGLATTITGSTDPNTPTLLTPAMMSTGNFYNLQGNFVLPAGVTTWSNYKFAMEPNSKINVTAGSVLRLDNTHFYACNYMWDGIYVDGGVLGVNNNNLFESALNAIVQKNNSSVTLATPNTGFRTMFNRCLIGVDIKTNPSATNVMKINRCSFTSRALLPSSVYTSPVLPLAYLPTVSSTYAINNYTNYPSANCITPYTQYKGYIGVRIDDNKDVLVGFQTTNATLINVFDNLHYGIMSRNSNITVVNNEFYYILAPTIFTKKSLPCPEGTCICAQGVQQPSGVTPKITRVGITSTNAIFPNKFTGSREGIYNTNYLSLNAQNNTFRSMVTRSIFNQFGSNFTLLGGLANSVVVLGNKIDVSPIGIYLNDNRNATIQIDNNEIDWASGAWNTITTSQSTSGIIVNNAIANFSGSLSITSNKLANCVQAIKLTLQGYPGTGNNNRGQVADNMIRFNQFACSTVGSGLYYGIGLFNSSRITIDGFNTNMGDITRTTSGTCPLASINTPSEVQVFEGVRVEDSPETWITDLTVRALPASIYVKGSCPNSNFWCNNLSGAYNGFYMNNANIGNQINIPSAGLVNVATDNQWTAPVSVSQKMAGVVSPASIWYYNPGNPPLYNPTASSVSNLSFAGNSGSPCAFLFQVPGPGPNATARALMHQRIVEKQEVFNANQLANSEWSSNYSYRWLKENPEWVTMGTPDDNKYQDFMVNYSGKTLLDVVDQIDRGGNAAAIHDNNNAVVLSTAQTERKKVNNIYLNTWNQGITELSPSDAEYLCWLSAQDPVTHGDAVYTAQVMIGNCGAEVQASAALRQSAQDANKGASGNSSSVIYPNPNNGKMKAVVRVSEEKKGALELFDVQGKILGKYELTSGENVFDINQEDIQPGLYFYRIVIDGEIIETKKIVIVK